MATILFPDFLEDTARYQAAADFWQAQLATTLADLGLHAQTYLNNITGDGSQLLDGNPIYHAYFPARNRALRIIQEEPLLPADYGSWVGNTEIESQEVPELVISLVLTDENVERALEEIQGWLTS
jgi:hypothetical protein